MVKYIHYLLSDIETAIQNAPKMPGEPLLHDFDGDDGGHVAPPLLLEALVGIPAISFPPHQRLTEAQVSALLQAIERLWGHWNLRHDLPAKLTPRQRYHAMLHAMRHEDVRWSYESGGQVKVCQYESGSFCPFGESGGYCHCRELDEAVQHDIAIWEEHVRSQGLDPYRELT